MDNTEILKWNQKVNSKASFFPSVTKLESFNYRIK